MADAPSTFGVQQLIDRLSQEGVAEGKRLAEETLAKTRGQANAIVEAARREAEEILQQAKHEAAQLRAGGEEAVALACRDAIRDLASRLHEGFRNRLQELVHHELQDPDLLRRMILEVTRKARPDQETSSPETSYQQTNQQDAPLEIILPPEIIQEEDVRQQIQAGNHDALTQFVQGLLGEGVRQGFTVRIGQDHQTGLRVHVVDHRVEIDFTDQAISELLARHLLPRFRAILQDQRKN